MLKKNWMIYNYIFLVILVFFAGMDYLTNFLVNARVYNSLYAGLGSWVAVFNTLLFLPVWLIVLFVNRHSMNLKAFLQGLFLSLISVGAGIYCIVAIIGYMGGQT